MSVRMFPVANLWQTMCQLIAPIMYMVICMSSLLLHEVESSECSAEAHSGGTTFHLHKQIYFCNENSWCFNNTMVANEVYLKHMMVLSRSPHNSLFKSCYDTVTVQTKMSVMLKSSTALVSATLKSFPVRLTHCAGI